jgi:DNA-binding transcriptional LysR family regulator
MADRYEMMRVFVAVVETGSFSAAARRLRLGQPAVSKAVAALEDRLGVQLLTRSTRSQSITEAGQRFLDHARLALDEADAADAAARDEGVALHGRLRIAAPPVYASQVIIPRLADFLALHPGMDLDLVLDDRHIDLIEEGVDLAIRAGDLASSNLIARRIDKAQRLLVASKAYLAQHGTPAHPRAMAGHQIASYIAFDALTSWTLSRGEERETITALPRLRVNAAEGLRAIVMAGVAIGLVTNRMVERELAAGLLVHLLPDWSLPASDVWVIFPEGRRVRQRSRLFVDWLEQAIKADRTRPAS